MQEAQSSDAATDVARDVARGADTGANNAFGFAAVPLAPDYLRLAAHLDRAPPGLHPALRVQTAATADALRRMARDPERQAHRAAYHTLRLMVP